MERWDGNEARCAAAGCRTLLSDELAASCRKTREGPAWLERLPGMIGELTRRWSLALGAPFDSSAAWVAPAERGDGRRVVLKIGLPHMESAHEIDGLRWLDGDPTVRLLEADGELDAMLLERCDPGHPLSRMTEPEQDAVVARLLPRFWGRRPAAGHPFRPLSAMIAHWREETLAAAPEGVDRGLIQEGLRLLEDLSRPAAGDVLLATDLHAGNVLRAQREPWLAIDPKPFIGDRAYDATQHLMNCRGRMRAAPDATIRRFAELLEVEPARVRLWMFARAAAEPRDVWDGELFEIARALKS